MKKRKYQKKYQKKSANLIYVLFAIFFLVFTTLALYALAKNTGRLSYKSKASMSIGDTDPLTGEFYDLQIDAYPVKTITRTNAGPRYITELTLQAHGVRVNDTQELYGFVQSPFLPYEPTQINFTFQEFNFPRFKSEPINLVNSGCIDLHRSQNPDTTNYIGTFCYKLAYLQPGNELKTVYSASSDVMIQFNYKEVDVGTLVSFTTAFNKYNYTVPYDGTNRLGTRVNYYTIDTGSSLNSFTNVVYYLPGLTSGLSNLDQAKLCTITNAYPDKYLKQVWSPKPEGGNSYLITEKSGYCDFVARFSFLKPGYISLYMEGGLLFPTLLPTPTTTEASSTRTKTKIIRRPKKSITLIPSNYLRRTR